MCQLKSMMPHACNLIPGPRPHTSNNQYCRVHFPPSALIFRRTCEPVTRYPSLQEQGPPTKADLSKKSRFIREATAAVDSLTSFSNAACGCDLNNLNITPTSLWEGVPTSQNTIYLYVTQNMKFRPVFAQRLLDFPSKVGIYWWCPFKSPLLEVPKGEMEETTLCIP